MTALAKFQALTSSIISRAKTAALLGKTYGSDRDLYAVLGYPRVITFEHYKERFLRDGVSRRVVAAYPQATWRNTPQILEKGKRFEESQFAQDFDRLAKRTKLFHYLERADKLAGVGSYGTILLGIRASGQLRDPVRMSRSRDIDDLLYFGTYMEDSAQIEKFETDPTSPQFGMPLLYNVDLFGDMTGVSQYTIGVPSVPQHVHYSRIIHVAEDTTEDEVFGQPRLRAVWNYLDDLNKIVGGSSEAIWRNVDRGLHFDVDKDAQLDEDDLADFSDEIEQYVHQFQRYIRTRGVRVQSLGADMADPTGAANVVLGLISGTTGIPKRVLTGSEMGQLASSQDEKNFNSRVRERQTSFAEPRMLRPLIDRLIAVGILPEVEYEVEWPDLSTLTAKEKSDVSARMGQAAKSFNEVAPGFITPEEIRTKYFDLPREKAPDDTLMLTEEVQDGELQRDGAETGGDDPAGSGN